MRVINREVNILDFGSYRMGHGVFSSRLSLYAGHIIITVVGQTPQHSFDINHLDLDEEEYRMVNEAFLKGNTIRIKIEVDN